MILTFQRLRSQAPKFLLGISLLALAACNPSKEDAAEACSKNTRQTVDACACWIDLVERKVRKDEFELFLLEQTDPERARKQAEDWSTGKALSYADRVMTTVSDARRTCRFNPFGL